MSLLIGVVSISLAAAVYAADVSDLVAATLWWLGGINVVLALFNLLPAPARRRPGPHCGALEAHR